MLKKSLKIIGLILAIALVLIVVLTGHIIHVFFNGYNVTVRNYVSEQQYDQYKDGQEINTISPQYLIHMDGYDLRLNWWPTEGNTTRGPYQFEVDIIILNRDTVENVYIENISLYSSLNKNYVLGTARMELLSNYLGGKDARTHRLEQTFDFNHRKAEEIILEAEINTIYKNKSSELEKIKVKFLPIKTNRRDSMLSI